MTDLSYRRRPVALRLRKIFRALGPAMARPRGTEPWRAAIGAAIGLLICSGVIALCGGGAGFILVAPLGATAFLLFTVPNSPLAQPWSVVAGNGLASAFAVTIVLNLGDGAFAAALAVGGTILLLATARALHPPAASAALATVLTGDLVREIGYLFVLSPILLNSAVLVLFAVVYNRLTGRVYPFRQPKVAAPTVPVPMGPGLALTVDELADILNRFNLAANIGVEDLRRLIAAAEAEARGEHITRETEGLLERVKGIEPSS